LSSSASVGDGAQQRLEQFGRRDASLEHLLPQRDGRASARQRIGEGVQVRQQVVARGAGQAEAAVADAAAGRQHEVRHGQALRASSSTRRLSSRSGYATVLTGAVPEDDLQTAGSR
jgi:hypothetical protein